MLSSTKGRLEGAHCSKDKVHSRFGKEGCKTTVSKMCWILTTCPKVTVLFEVKYIIEMNSKQFLLAFFFNAFTRKWKKYNPGLPSDSYGLTLC